jgi:hypothetical protein
VIPCCHVITQGEESDIVIASLVRCNVAGSVGFLREPERINVLLSRARNGMILIGSASTLRNASSAEARLNWGKVLSLLEQRSSLLSAFPAQCQLHGTITMLDSPEAFEQHAPHGGCMKPCEELMPCGHKCTLQCHAYDRGHVKVWCPELVYEYCDASPAHLITRE